MAVTDKNNVLQLKYSTNRLGKHLWAEAFWRAICAPDWRGDRIVQITIEDPM